MPSAGDSQRHDYHHTFLTKNEPLTFSLALFSFFFAFLSFTFSLFITPSPLSTPLKGMGITPEKCGATHKKSLGTPLVKSNDSLVNLDLRGQVGDGQFRLICISVAVILCLRNIVVFHSLSGKYLHFPWSYLYIMLHSVLFLFCFFFSPDSRAGYAQYHPS